MELVYFLLIGLVAGWLAGLVMKGKGFGLIGNLVFGCIGAFLGRYLLDLLKINTYGKIGSLVAAFIGAVILVWIIGLIKRK